MLFMVMMASFGVVFVFAVYLNGKDWDLVRLSQLDWWGIRLITLWQ